MICVRAHWPAGGLALTFFLRALRLLQQGAVNEGYDSVLKKSGATLNWGGDALGSEFQNVSARRDSKSDSHARVCAHHSQVGILVFKLKNFIFI